MYADKRRTHDNRRDGRPGGCRVPAGRRDARRCASPAGLISARSGRPPHARRSLSRIYPNGAVFVQRGLVQNAAGNDDQQDEENQDNTRGRECSSYTGHVNPSLNLESGYGLLICGAFPPSSGILYYMSGRRNRLDE